MDLKQQLKEVKAKRAKFQKEKEKLLMAIEILDKEIEKTKRK